ncbi:Serine/threonine-protein kinase ULK3 [Fasciola gigantica]|uniref:Serine/threonine-protein kinase ULK3 n=1 Tax=Fasciola gigantica TaxID=46835 RepID=A0A504Z0H9_FASGI|nr:Serine/threonine-protein kinase ULK3 [Fasciola gigantica]
MFSLQNCAIIRKLGQGAYGEVYLARLKVSEKVMAIKCIPKTKLNKRGQDNLVSEISILQKLRHPHIVRLVDFSWDSERVYLFMEYCAGGDLSQFIRTKRRLSEQLVRRFLRQLGMFSVVLYICSALALQYLHKKNIIHMDLKPQNILLTSGTNPVLKVSDFGFAQCHTETIKTNELRGTLLYMAPEIYCEGIYHPSCDLWSVGVILYECLFGSAPYAFCDSRALREKLTSGEVIKLPTSVSISADCAALVKGLLKRNPLERINHEDFFAHPFLDLKHAPSARSLDKALEFLESAWDLEKRGDLKLAHECYTRGLAHLLSAVEYQTSPGERAELRRLAVRYFEQAEKVKKLLDEEKLASVNRPERPPRPKLLPVSKDPVVAANTAMDRLVIHQKPSIAVGCSLGRSQLQRQMTVPERPAILPESDSTCSLTNSVPSGRHSTYLGNLYSTFRRLLLGDKPTEKKNSNLSDAYQFATPEAITKNASAVLSSPPRPPPPAFHSVCGSRVTPNCSTQEVTRESELTLPSTSQPMHQQPCSVVSKLPSTAQGSMSPSSDPTTGKLLVSPEHPPTVPENLHSATRLNAGVVLPSQLSGHSDQVTNQSDGHPHSSCFKSIQSDGVRARTQSHTNVCETASPSSSSESSSVFSSDEFNRDSLVKSGRIGHAPEKLARLRQLTTCISPHIPTDAGSESDHTLAVLPEIPALQMALLSDTERLCELSKSRFSLNFDPVLWTALYNTSKQISEVTSILQKEGIILVTLSNPQTIYPIFFCDPSGDSNETRRRAFMKELRLVLDLVENSQQQRKAELVHPSEKPANASSPLNLSPVVQEVGVEPAEDIDPDHCCVS